MASDFNSTSFQIGCEVHELQSVIMALANRLRYPEQRKMVQRELGPIFAANKMLANLVWELRQPDTMEAAE